MLAGGHGKGEMPTRLMRTHLLMAIVVAAALLAATSSTRAQTDWTGKNSNNWFDAGNWTAGVPTDFPPFGQRNAVIDTVSPNATVVAAPGATVMSLFVGNSGTGMLTVTGAGSTLTAGRPLAGGGIAVGNSGTGTLTISDGGNVNSFAVSVGLAAGSQGTVTVTGAALELTTNADIGISGKGTFTQNGGTVTVNNQTIIGNLAGSQGTVKSAIRSTTSSTMAAHCRRPSCRSSG